MHGYYWILADGHDLVPRQRDGCVMLLAGMSSAQGCVTRISETGGASSCTTPFFQMKLYSLSSPVLVLLGLLRTLNYQD